MTDLLNPERIALRVFGTPITQGSKKKGRFSLYDDNAETLGPWRARVTAEAKDHCQFFTMLTGPVRCWLRFTFDRPPSHYRSGRNAHLLKDSAPRYPTYKKDVDKLERAIFDSLTKAEVWADDGLVVDVRARKFYAGEHELALDHAGVVIILEEIS